MSKRSTRFSVSALIVTSFLAASGVAAEAKQCVWNKAGFILEVHWYKPGDILYDQKGEFYIRPTGSQNQPVAPAQLDVYPVAQGRCWEGSEQMIAVLAIKDGQLFNTLMTAGTSIVVGAATGIASAAACVVTAATACPVSIAGAVAATGALTTAMQLAAQTPQLKGTIPNVFAITVPGAGTVLNAPGLPPNFVAPGTANRWLDVWGTVMSPQIGPGGPL